MYIYYHNGIGAYEPSTYTCRAYDKFIYSTFIRITHYHAGLKDISRPGPF